MPRISAVECDNCQKLTKKGFTVTVECEGAKFNFKGSRDQPKLVLVLCIACTKKLGDIIDGALQA